MNKTAHLSIPSPYNLIKQNKVNFVAATPAEQSGLSSKSLTPEEVSICGRILTLARTHFEKTELG